VIGVEKCGALSILETGRKGSARGSQFDPVSAARQQLGTDLVFQIPDLAAEGWLGRVQTLLRRHGEASRVCDRNEIAKMS